MPLLNHTPYPALAFQGVDPLGQEFHVLAVRQTLTWQDDGLLVPAETQLPLCEEDQRLEVAGGRRVTMQESDLCQFKPCADVLVNATAHAPRGWPASRFDVRLALRRPGADALLLDKRLAVCGPRQMGRRTALSGLSGPRWSLSEPQPFLRLPLTLAQSWGGQLVDREGCEHAFAANPAGVGWWNRRLAGRVCDVEQPAPRIEDPGQPLTPGLVEQAEQGDMQITAVGLGVRPKSHPARVALAGRVDEVFAGSDAPLPQGFDFAVWNCAWPDQQLAELVGDEWIGLINLCAPDTPAARMAATGDTLLGLSLPGTLPFVLVRWQDGRLGELAMRLDTLIVEPEEHRVSCVWRAVMPLYPAVRVLELRELGAGGHPGDSATTESANEAEVG